MGNQEDRVMELMEKIFPRWQVAVFTLFLLLIIVIGLIVESIVYESHLELDYQYEEDQFTQEFVIPASSSHWELRIGMRTTTSCFEQSITTNIALRVNSILVYKGTITDRTRYVECDDGQEAADAGIIKTFKNPESPLNISIEVKLIEDWETIEGIIADYDYGYVKLYRNPPKFQFFHSYGIGLLLLNAGIFLLDGLILKRIFPTDDWKYEN